MRVAAWTAAAIAGYVILYPMLVTLYYDMVDGVLFDAPHWLDDAVDFTVVPLVWLIENFPAYERLIDWMDELFPDL